MSEGCDLLEQSTGFLVGYPRAPFASVVTPLSWASPASAPPSRLIAAYSGEPSWVRGARAPGLLRDEMVGKPSREGSGDPLRDPPKGGSGTPQKGGCRDTKQCKFWRVSSVLIQGLFCFLGVRGGLRGGPPGGSILGVSRGGSQCPGPGGNPTDRPARVASPLNLGTQTKRTLGSPRFPASYLRWRCTCWGTQRERQEF